MPTEDLWVIFLDTDCKMNTHPPTNHHKPIPNLHHNPNQLFHNQIPQQKPTQFPLFHISFHNQKTKSNPKSKFNSRNRFQKSKLHLPIRKSHSHNLNAFSCLNLQIIHKRFNLYVKPNNIKFHCKFRSNQSDSLKITQDHT